MRPTVLILLVVVTCCITGFNKKATHPFSKEVDKQFVRVSDSLYWSRFEVTNADYRAFLHFLKQHKTAEEYEVNQLDTARWASKGVSNRPLVVFYHAHSSYNNYPVVTVSYNNAVNYCVWLTSQYNADPSRKFKKVEFRLPSELEWIHAATAGRQGRLYAWDGNQLRNKKGEYLANIRRINEANITLSPESNQYKIVQDDQEKTVGILAPTHSFLPNEYGLYNMIGNAAEMVLEEGKAKGGSYKDPGFDVRVTNVKHYTTASPELGFRPVMEVLEK